MAKKIDNKGIPFLELDGDHKAIGRAHGEERRETIRKFIGELTENVLSRGRVNLDQKLLMNIIRKHWTFSAEYSQDLESEIMGIADGAGVEPIQIMFLNSFLDLVTLRDDRLAAAIVGCTCVGATSIATENGNTYLAQNYDMEAFYGEYMQIMRIKPKGAPSSLVYSFAGVLGCAGLNERGIGLNINFLHPRDAYFGVVYPFVVRNILAQVSIGNAVGAATIGRKAGGIHYLIGSCEGLIFGVETSSEKHDVILPDSKGIIAHTNHYMSERMKDIDVLLWDNTYDSAIGRRGSTLIRQHVAQNLLAQNAGKISIKDIEEILSNHHNYPLSICFHGEKGKGRIFRGETVASIINDLCNKEMLISFGKACKADYHRFSFSEK